MTAEELSAHLEAHHARTAMMSTAELYHLLPAIISALRDNVRMREALENARESLYVIATQSQYEWSDTRQELQNIIAAAVECAQNGLAALTESQPVPGNVESEPRRP